jgi:archaemetzincin
MRYYSLLLLIAIFLVGCDRSSAKVVTITQEESDAYKSVTSSLESLQEDIGFSGPDDWQSLNKEKQQSFRAYRFFDPVTATPERNTLYIAQLNTLDSMDLRMLLSVKEYLSVFYQCDTKIIFLPVDIDAVPEKYYRINSIGEKQILTDFYLKEVLYQNLPTDAIGLIGCTSLDIYPDPKWNFVFGKASLRKRVAVWSTRRLEKLGFDANENQHIVQRNLKTASHESAHIFSLLHCVDHRCLMNGSANLQDSDRRPMHLCNSCLGKLHWNRKFDLEQRFALLFNYWDTADDVDEMLHYEVSRELILKKD